MDLDLLDRTLADAGEPAFRARQAWRWTAGGAAGYDEMTEPAGRAARAPGRRGSVLHAHARPRGARARRHGQGALPHPRRPPRRGRADALPRRPPLGLRLLAVGLPADLHVLRHGRDEVRPQPDRERDPRPGPALPPHRAAQPPRVHGDGRADDEPRQRARRGPRACPTSASPTAAPASPPSAGRPASASSPSPTCRSGSRSRCTRPRTRCARRSCPSTSATRSPRCSRRARPSTRAASAWCSSST